MGQRQSSGEARNRKEKVLFFCNLMTIFCCCFFSLPPADGSGELEPGLAHLEPLRSGLGAERPVRRPFGRRPAEEDARYVAVVDLLVHLLVGDGLCRSVRQSGCLRCRPVDVRKVGELAGDAVQLAVQSGRQSVQFAVARERHTRFVARTSSFTEFYRVL